MNIKLTDADVALATEIGTQRHTFKQKHRRDDLAQNVRGAAAELAVARLLGTEIFDEWLAHRAYLTDEPHRGADLGLAVEIKTIRKADHSLLIPRTEINQNHTEHAIVLVLVDLPVCTVRGWVAGHEAMRPEFWDETLPRPCWRVPEDLLQPFHTLPQEYVR